MSIAALGSAWLLSLTQNAIAGTNVNKATTSQETANTKSASGSNNDCDTFQLSLSAAMMMNGSTAARSGTGNIKDDIGDFLSKVANGTVNSTDLQKMQEELQQAQQAGGVKGHHHRHHHHDGDANAQETQIAGGVGSDLRSFLEKLVKGTATDADFKSIEAEIAAVSNNTGTATTTGSTASSAGEILRVSGVSRSLLNSATDAYNTQAYFGSHNQA